MLGFVIAVAAAIASPSPSPTTRPAVTPTSPHVRASVEKSLGFMEKAGIAWLDNSKCIACHHGAWMVWGFNEAQHAGISVDPKKIDMLTSRVLKIYLADVPGHQKKKSGWVESTYMLLSQYDASPKKGDDWRATAASLIVAGQLKEGSWKYAGQGLERPDAENDEATTLWALLALPTAKDTPAADSESRAKAMAWLKDVKQFPGLDSLALRLALESRYGDPARASALKDELISRQNPDGGWKWSEKRPSDAFATGESLYALSLAGVKSDTPAVQKAWAFLLSTQQADGSWLCHTRKPKGGDKIATYWGTAWAVIGLSHSLPPQVVTEAR